MGVWVCEGVAFGVCGRKYFEFDPLIFSLCVCVGVGVCCVWCVSVCVWVVLCGGVAGVCVGVCRECQLCGCVGGWVCSVCVCKCARCGVKQM